MRPTTQTLVIGIGNAWRGDDAAGLLAAHALRARELPGVTVVETNVVDPSLIESWHRFDLSRESLPGGLSFCSSHAFDLAALLNLAQTLDRLPPQVWVFGVEAHDFTHGHAVSEAVLLGVTACVETMVGLLDGATARPEN